MRFLAVALGVASAVAAGIVDAAPESRAPAAAAQERAAADGADDRGESLTAWQYRIEVKLPADADAPLREFVVPPAVFDGARPDLADLRLYDAAGKEVPYALQVRRPTQIREDVPLAEFNRASLPGGAAGVSLDLNESPSPYNEIEVRTAGANFRRRLLLEGSDDGESWSRLLEGELVRVALGGGFEYHTLSFPESRFRYLRVQVQPDPHFDADRPLRIEGITVRRRIELPGELASWPASIGPREPVRAYHGPGSAWMLDLGGRNVPVERLVVEVDDAEFARDYAIERLNPPGAWQPFYSIDGGQWVRRRAEERKPLVAEIREVQTDRLRLVVTDDRNPPLALKSVRVEAAARVVVFSPDGVAEPLHLYFGNPGGAPPRYDFARTLPDRLEPRPARLTLSEREENPIYQPPPMPLTERWPWLVYAVLGGAAAVLAVLVASLARAAIAQADRAAATAAPQPQG